MRHHPPAPTRREFFSRTGTGLAAIALASLLEEDAIAARAAADPLEPKPPHVAPRAKSVIF
jgi:hypothetical protein